MGNSLRIVQCGSCEEIFTEDKLDDGCCSFCGSGNWVYGYLDCPDNRDDNANCDGRCEICECNS